MSHTEKAYKRFCKRRFRAYMFGAALFVGFVIEVAIIAANITIP